MNGNEIIHEIGSGNVFDDIGLEDAGELSFKSKLVITIKTLQKSERLTQQKLAIIVGTDQPTISKVFRGQLDLVSVDRLFHWLNKLGKDVDVIIRSPRLGREGEPQVSQVVQAGQTSICFSL